MNKTLPEDSKERKNYPLLRGLFRYFPAALAGVARTSKAGNDKHNPGEEMHHARDKSSDHGDCILRHLMDTEDLLAGLDRGEDVTKEKILEEVNCLAWRALALSQELHEKFGAPLAPGAKKDVVKQTRLTDTNNALTKEEQDRLFCEKTKNEVNDALRKMTNSFMADLEKDILKGLE